MDRPESKMHRFYRAGDLRGPRSGAGRRRLHRSLGFQILPLAGAMACRPTLLEPKVDHL